MNDDIKIFDNIIPKGYQDALEALITDELFEWGYANDVVWDQNSLRKGQSLKQVNDGFGHMLCVPKHESKHWPFIKPLIYHINEALGEDARNIFRVRVNLLLKAYPNDLPWNNEHIDSPTPHYTGIYYVNDTDGPTYIFDQKVTDIPHKNWTQDVVLKYVNSTEFTVAQAVEPKKGRLVVFNGQRFHASSKPRENQNRIVIALNWQTQNHLRQHGTTI
jgi:hypothetical protein